MKETMMLDYSNEKIQQLIKERKWNELDEFECIRDIYNFVRDEILFGYNIDDSLHKRNAVYGIAESVQYSLQDSWIYD